MPGRLVLSSSPFPWLSWVRKENSFSSSFLFFFPFLSFWLLLLFSSFSSTSSGNDEDTNDEDTGGERRGSERRMLLYDNRFPDRLKINQVMKSTSCLLSLSFSSSLSLSLLHPFSFPFFLFILLHPVPSFLSIFRQYEQFYFHSLLPSFLSDQKCRKEGEKNYEEKER